MLDAYADYAAPSFDNRMNDIMVHMDNSNSTSLTYNEIENIVCHVINSMAMANISYTGYYASERSHLINTCLKSMKIKDKLKKRTAANKIINFIRNNIKKKKMNILELTNAHPVIYDLSKFL